MWREIAWAGALAMLLLVSGEARAVDPESTQAYCDQVRDASKEAQRRYVLTFKPRQDPGKTFDDATRSCLDGILSYPSSFQFTLPTMAAVQEILRQMGKRLMLQACQAARDEFDRAVRDAMNTVNGTVDQINGYGQLPGGGVNIGYSTVRGPAPAPQPAPKSAPKSESTWDAIVNFLSGGSDKR